MERRRREPPIITKLRARNFRSLGEVNLDLGPLTVLVGPNASGKSNTVDVLRFVADALRMDLDAAIVARNGIKAIRRWSDKRPYDVTIGLRIEGPKSSYEYEFILGSGPEGQYAVKEERGTVELGSSAFKFAIRRGRLVEPSIRGGTIKGRISGQLPLLEPAVTFEQTSLALPVLRRMFRFWPQVTKSKYRNRLEIHESLLSLHSFLKNMRMYHMFPNEIRELHKPLLPYPLEEHGENLVSALREMKAKSEFFPDLLAALGKVVPGVREIRVTPSGGFLVGKLEHFGARGDGKGVWFDFSQESDGTLRLLGLLVALFQSPPPSLIAIEEPELTIHPGALAVLADLLEEATQRSQILVTTHSPDLIDRFPVQYLRAVELTKGVTTVNMVAEHQREAIKRGLFSPGELHRGEGLQPAEAKR